MGQVHIKGRILQLLARAESLWDYEIVDVITKEYGLSGPYWVGTVRMTLTDLHAGGLVDYIESKVDEGPGGGGERLLNRYRLNGFGRERIRQTGLMEGVA